MIQKGKNRGFRTISHRIVDSEIAQSVNTFPEFNILGSYKQSKKFYRSKEAAHKKHYKIKRGQAIEGLDPESIKICLHENNFTELFDNLGILGEYQLECTNLLSEASDVVAQKRNKKYGDKIAVPDEDDSVSDRDWSFKIITEKELTKY